MQTRNAEKWLEERIGEFSDCYVLIGYDRQGNKIKIMAMDSERDRDAMKLQLDELFFELEIDEED